MGFAKYEIPKGIKESYRPFLGGANFCRKFFKNRRHILVPLTDLTSNVPFKWTKAHQESFDKIKSVIA